MLIITPGFRVKTGYPQMQLMDRDGGTKLGSPI